MAGFFRTPDRRQRDLLPVVDIMDWFPSGDIVHWLVEAVDLIDLAAFAAVHRWATPARRCSPLRV